MNGTAITPEDIAYEIGLDRAFPYRNLTSDTLAPYMARRLAPCDLAAMLTRTQIAALRGLAADSTAERNAGNRRLGMLNALVAAGLIARGLATNPSESQRYRKPYVTTYTTTARGRSVLAHIA